MKLYVAIPALDEQDWIFNTLDCLRSQDHPDFEVWVCVNQPEDWWQDPSKLKICESNVSLLSSLNDIQGLTLRIIDHCSKGQGWPSGKGGVGWARKVLMDGIAAEANEDDIIVSLDADTAVPENYFSSLAGSFKAHAEVTGVSVPYLHELGEEEPVNRAMLRYEIYLRYYALNMWRTGSPYTFTALGSAMACPVWAYRKAGGITPKESGEDFYFLQKLAKIGPLLHWINSKVSPAARMSDRVPFGTGPAMIKGGEMDWSSYPIISSRLFDDVRDTIELFPALYDEDVETPMSAFLRKQLKTDSPWRPLRDNYNSLEAFMRACHDRVDGLRIFQYLRLKNMDELGSDEDHLQEYLLKYHLQEAYEGVDFRKSSIESLNDLRVCLMDAENKMRQASE
jgi:hypothetical protein